jgi:IS30 family transposase
MPKGYHHLTHIRRCQIFTLKARGDSYRSIANHLNVHPSTISREIKRNSGLKGYHHTGAHQKATFRKNKPPNNKMSAKIITALREKLKIGWSPVQISGHLKLHGNQSVSHETIINIFGNTRNLVAIFIDRFVEKAKSTINEQSKMQVVG